MITRVITGNGRDGSITKDVDAGPFWFLGSQTPTDLASGKVVCRYEDLPREAADRLRTGMLMVDAPDERILVQTWLILANVQALPGLTLQRIVHQRFFLRDMRDRAGLERAIVAFFGSTLPSATIVEARAAGVHPDIAVHADFVVLSAPSHAITLNVSIPELDSLTAPFPLATRAGQYIFTSPIAGVDLRTGAAVTRFTELHDSEQVFADPPYTPRGESVAAQQVMVFRHIESILRSQGSSLAWQLRQNGWMRLSMREFGPASRVRKRLFAGPNIGPFTSLQVSGIRHPDAHFEYGVMALVPPRVDGDHAREVPSTPHGIASYYVGAVRSGPYVISAGEVPVDIRVPKVVLTFADLEGNARLLGYGSIYADKPVMAQAHFVYARLRDCLEAQGSSLHNAVHQTVYMRDPSDYPALEHIATLFFGARLPATTVIPIAGTSPYAEAEIEIEVIAMADDVRDSRIPLVSATDHSGVLRP